MSFGISKTIPASRGINALNDLYNGKLSEFEFHMAGKPRKLNIDDYVYTIFENMLHGRLKIKDLISGHINPSSGAARTLVIVEAPGERLKDPIPKVGHRGTRYYDGTEWPEES